MFRAIATLALASSAAAQPASTLSSTAPWWEKVTVTVTGDGEPQSCLYQTSSNPKGARNCDVVGAQAAAASGTDSATKSQYTRITFERRFSPGGKPASADLAPGETFLGGQMMALAINGAGSVKNCKVLATTGSMLPQYGCKEATAERFAANAASAAEPQEGYMTILVYAHAEHVV